MMKTHLITAVSVLSLVGALFAAPVNHPPIAELKDLRAKDVVFTDASERKPLVMNSPKDGAKYFDRETLAAISKSVDFEKQFVLIFAWEGSGQDVLDFLVLESFPEQIRFSYKQGMTKDLRQHVKVFVLRSNVKWLIAK
jgi:hypothetical protein